MIFNIGSKVRVKHQMLFSKLQYPAAHNIVEARRCVSPEEIVVISAICPSSDTVEIITNDGYAFWGLDVYYLRPVSNLELLAMSND